MSESKYNPPVNIPVNVPERPESMMCVFFPTTQHLAVTMDQLILMPGKDNTVALGYWAPAPPPKEGNPPADPIFLPIVTFNDCILTMLPKKGTGVPLAEKTIVVP